MSVAPHTREMGRVKINPTNLELVSEIVPPIGPVNRSAGRFQVIVEYGAGVCISTAVAQSPEEAVETFMSQVPGCEEGEISLFDRDEHRIVASVKWKMSETEIGLRVPHRHNIFHDWHLSLIALGVQTRRAAQAGGELSA